MKALLLQVLISFGASMMVVVILLNCTNISKEAAAVIYVILYFAVLTVLRIKSAKRQSVKKG